MPGVAVAGGRYMCGGRRFRVGARNDDLPPVILAKARISANARVPDTGLLRFARNDGGALQREDARNDTFMIRLLTKNSLINKFGIEKDICFFVSDFWKRHFQNNFTTTLLAGAAVFYLRVRLRQGFILKRARKYIQPNPKPARWVKCATPEFMPLTERKTSMAV